MSGAYPIITLISDGQKLDIKDNKLISVDIQKFANKIPFAKLTIAEGGALIERFRASDTDFFEPGKNIEIKLRYEGKSGSDGKDQTAFSGIVAKHRIKSSKGAFYLIVDIKDKTFDLTISPKSRVFEKGSIDKDIIEKVIQDAGAAAADIDGMDLENDKEMVQFCCTDWDFIITRAKACRCWAVADGGNISILSPPVLKDKEVKREFKDTDIIYDFELETDSEMLKGRLNIAGTLDIDIGDVISLSKIAKHFSGIALVSGIHHTLDYRGWLTDIFLGWPNTAFLQPLEVRRAPAEGLVPGIRGLHIGTVEEFADDPDNLFRVKVRINETDENDSPVWARLCSIDSGNKRGIFFRPEKGDEVILGFIDEDPRHPIILGAVYGENNRPPVLDEDIKQENFLKGIYTREKLKIEFDEEKKQITIATPENNSIVLTQDTQDDIAGIIWTDQNGNTIKTDKSGIVIKDQSGAIISIEKDSKIDIQDKEGNKAVLECESGITIEDKEGSKIVFDSTGLIFETGKNISIKAGDIDIQGSDIKIEGKGNITLNATAINMN